MEGLARSESPPGHPRWADGRRGLGLLDMPNEVLDTLFSIMFQYSNSAARYRIVSAMMCRRLRSILNDHMARDIHLKKANSLARMSYRFVGSDRLDKVLSLRLDLETEDVTEGHIKNLWLNLNTLIRLMPNLKSLQLNLSKVWTRHIMDDRDAFNDSIASLRKLKRLGVKHIHQITDMSTLSPTPFVQLLDPTMLVSLSLIGDGIVMGSEAHIEDEKMVYSRIVKNLKVLDLSCHIRAELLQSILRSTTNLTNLALRLGPNSPSSDIIQTALKQVAPQLEILHLGVNGRIPEGQEIPHRGLLKWVGQSMQKLNMLTLDGAFWHRHLDECLPSSLEYLSFIITPKFPFSTLAVMIALGEMKLKKIYIRGAFNPDGEFSALDHKAALHAFKLACEQRNCYVGWLPFGVDSIPF